MQTVPNSRQQSARFRLWQCQILTKQECIPVRCVSSAAVAVCRGVSAGGGLSAQGDVCLGGVFPVGVSTVGGMSGRGVSAQGVSAQGGVYPGEINAQEVSAPGAVSQGSLCPWGVCPGGVCPGGVYTQGGVGQATPCEQNGRCLPQLRCGQ